MKIGLCGYARTGKDTAAAGLDGFRRFAFADALKADAARALESLGIMAHWDSPVFKEQWRPFLVALGAGMRGIDPDYWVKRLIYQFAARGVHPGDNVVISDVRYANEVRWILGRGGIVIRIDRPGYGPANDEEKRSFEEIEHVYPRMPRVNNDSTPEELVKAVKLACTMEQIPRLTSK